MLGADPARLVALAGRLRGPDRSVESTVRGMSMGRCLPPGSRIRIELTKRARYAVGEIVAFLDGRQVIVHRVVHSGLAEAGSGQVLTRGDVVLVPDPPVDLARILGPVTAVWREGGWAAVNGAPRRGRRARIVAQLALWSAIVMTRLSPRATGIVLSLLKRAEGAFHFARSRVFRRPAPVPRRTP